MGTRPSGLLRDISRQEMTTMFYRYAKSAGLDVSKAPISAPLQTEPKPPYAQDAMKWAVALWVSSKVWETIPAYSALSPIAGSLPL